MQIDYLKEMLKTLGLDERRIQMKWCSAAEGEKFALMAIEVTNEILELGPNPLKNRPAAKE
jgi:coenzyme F420-reducing hydrogenase delta subunit